MISGRNGLIKLIPNVSTLRSAMSACFSTDKKTALYDSHIAHGGQMVSFAGYSLPVQYDGLGVMKEHNHARSPGCAALFDVSHMGQIRWSGPDATAFIEHVVVGDIDALEIGEAKLSLIMNENGGIVDDTVITKCDGYIYMVINGACREKDISHFENSCSIDKFNVNMKFDAEQQLLALQGDGAKDVVARLAPALDVPGIAFMRGRDDVTIAGIGGCRITRCGYTGEDGFEISVSPNDAQGLFEALVSQPEVKPAGLGARDSLRLEAGLCLYGHDLDDTVTPVEGGLTWTMGGPKSRRRLNQGFLGAEHVLKPDGKLLPVQRKRVGVSGMKAPARENVDIYDSKGEEKIGVITSGGFGPSVKHPIAMGYVQTAFSKEGTEISLALRGKMLPAKVTKMPFITTNYFKIGE